MNKKLLLGGAIAVLVVSVGVVYLSATPSIGAVSATPAYGVINTPTTIVVTAQISDPSLIPTGVNLLRVDSSGKTLATVGVMHDDGTSGDATAGDKTFSLAATVNESSVGPIYYRVSAAFKGVMQRAISTSVTVTMDPIKLPPDPGEAGKQTLEGIDSDGDGVRDDIERYIALRYPAQESLRTPLMAYAAASQDFILVAHDRLSARAISDRRDLATQCLVSRTPDNGFAIRDDVLSQQLNTPVRRSAYDDADRYLSGMIFTPPPFPRWSESCVALQ
jgi:hypothetical protein